MLSLIPVQQNSQRISLCFTNGAVHFSLYFPVRMNSFQILKGVDQVGPIPCHSAVKKLHSDTVLFTAQIEGTQ